MRRLLLVLALIGLSVTLEESQVASRHLASVKAGRTEMSKPHSLFAVELYRVGEVSASGELVLRGDITAFSTATDAQAQWILPEGVRLISGSTLVALGTMKANQTKQVQLTVAADSSVNRQISLHAYVSNGSRRLGSAAQYDTVLQDQIQAALKRARDNNAQLKSHKLIF